MWLYKEPLVKRSWVTISKQLKPVSWTQITHSCVQLTLKHSQTCQAI